MSGFSFFPPAIKMLLIANGAIFAIELLFGSFHTEGHESLGDFILQYLALWPIGSKFFFPWQLVTYMFLHQDFTHILFNMLALWMFGIEVEFAWGTKKFLTYYLVCGLGGATAHLIMSSMFGMEFGPLLGASGAIFGVLIAFGLMFPDRFIYVYFLIPVKAKYLVAAWIGLEVFSTLGASDNVSHLAHLGGAVTGIIYILSTTGGHLLRMRREAGTKTTWNGGARQEKPQGGGFFGGMRSRPSAVEAEYRDLDGNGHAQEQPQQDVKKARTISQDEVDRILDKIAASGYQNLTEDERNILFEASRRMEERR